MLSSMNPTSKMEESYKSRSYDFFLTYWNEFLSTASKVTEDEYFGNIMFIKKKGINESKGHIMAVYKAIHLIKDKSQNGPK